MNNRSTTSWFSSLQIKIEELGGLFNAHLHLDRAGTYEATLGLLESKVDLASSLSLSAKHSLIPLIHASDCYDPDKLEVRVREYIDLMIGARTTRADSLVDVTDDRVGLEALYRCIRIRDCYADRFDFRVGAYSPLGFRDDQPLRMELLEEGAQISDFLGALPERDDQADYPEHIGFEESCRRMLSLSKKLNKTLHLHIDQKNHDKEAGAECVIRLARELDLGCQTDTEPVLWLVHVISPAAYPEARFTKLVSDLVELNIGVICCPSAAISMRQLRPINAPTHNSIARVLEMLAAGVHVRIGSDNICDITSPAGTINLMDELFLLSNSLRYYDLEVLAKIGAGQSLTKADRIRISEHLEQDEVEISRAVAAYYARNYSSVI